MGTHLLLWTLGIGNAAFFTAGAARRLDIKRANWPLSLRLLVASLALPISWCALLLLVAFPLATAGAAERARFLGNSPALLREVVFPIAMKLWICAAISAVFLAYFSGPLKEHQPTSKGARAFLVWIAVMAACAIVVPMGLEYWIGMGQISPPFLLFFMAFAFLAGGLPLAIMQMVSLRRHGLDGLRRARTFIPGFGVLVAAGGFIWHSSIATRPGAWASWLLTASALAGVLVA